MALLHPDVLDAGLSVIVDDGDEIHICSQEPEDYTEATDTYSLGSVAASITGPADRSPSGREVTSEQVTGGTVTGDGEATHWALVDTANGRLLTAGALSAPQEVSNGNSFALTAFSIGIPGPAA